VEQAIPRLFFIPWLTLTIPASPFLADFASFLQRKFESLSGRLKACHHPQNLGFTGQSVRMFGVQSHALYLPGLWIDHANRDFAWTAQYLLDFAVDQYLEAVIAYSLFRPLIAQHEPGKPIATSVQKRTMLHSIEKVLQ